MPIATGKEHVRLKALSQHYSDLTSNISLLCHNRMLVIGVERERGIVFPMLHTGSVVCSLILYKGDCMKEGWDGITHEGWNGITHEGWTFIQSCTYVTKEQDFGY